MENLWRCVPLSRRLAALGSAGLLWAGLCVAPEGVRADGVRADGRQPFATDAARKSWTPPMRLGVKSERWRDTSPGTSTGTEAGTGANIGTGSTPKRAGPPSQCRKWQSMALQLGETYAGYTLRHGVLDRLCGDLGDKRLEDSWDWPWSGFASGRMAPPRMVRSIEAWDIRCGKAGARQRCTMLHSEPVPASDIPPSNNHAVSSHFVIDMVAGRESVLWRVFVPAELLDIGALKQPTAGSLVPASDTAAAPTSARAFKGGIRYRIGTVEHVERFSKCAAAGCIMEANLLHAGEVATSLWDGHDVTLTIVQPPGQSSATSPGQTSGRDAAIILPAHGFRAGLAELVRRRRDELRSARR